jgi:phosphatidylglycerophosphatase A
VSFVTRRLAILVCSFGYIGFFPFAPGTVGSAAGLVVYVACQWLHIPHFELPLIIVLFGLGVALGGTVERALGGIDPGPVVIDEVMGMLITLFLVPVNWIGMLTGFVLFRALDVLKPYPAKRLEHLPGGLGMMSDDAMAAVYANLALHSVYLIAPHMVS